MLLSEVSDDTTVEWDEEASSWYVQVTHSSNRRQPARGRTSKRYRPLLWWLLDIRLEVAAAMWGKDAMVTRGSCVFVGRE